MRSQFAAYEVSQWLRGLILASTSCSTHSGLWLVIRRHIVGSPPHLQFSFVWAESDDTRLFLGVCSHTLGICDTVVMETAVILWLLCG